MLLRAKHSCILAALPFAAACSSQADTQYRGEPLATITGTVQPQANVPPPGPSNVALLWAEDCYGPNAKPAECAPRRHLGTHVPVQGQFPASFTLSVYTPPPDERMIDCGPGRIAVAVIAVVKQEADTSNLQMSDIVGATIEFEVLYADRDIGSVRRGAPCDGILPGPISAGYHLARKRSESDMMALAQASDACWEQCHGDCDPIKDCPDGFQFYEWAPDGFATPITLFLGMPPQPSSPPPAPPTPTPSAPPPPKGP
jgi:hypothetical protein